MAANTSGARNNAPRIPPLQSINAPETTVRAVGQQALKAHRDGPNTAWYQALTSCTTSTANGHW